MYTTINFKTKKALKLALADGQRITVFQPGIFPARDNGTVFLEGPHYPEPHRWYAEGTLENGILVKVK